MFASQAAGRHLSLFSESVTLAGHPCTIIYSASLTGPSPSRAGNKFVSTSSLQQWNASAAKRENRQVTHHFFSIGLHETTESLRLSQT